MFKLRIAVGCLMSVMLQTGWSASAPSGDLVTIAERSGYKRTGRYDEVQRLCAAFQRTYASQVRCHEFARTPEGRPMLALIASADGTFEPARARERVRQLESRALKKLRGALPTALSAEA